jgi:hypothetical protein
MGIGVGTAVRALQQALQIPQEIPPAPASRKPPASC